MAAQPEQREEPTPEALAALIPVAQSQVAAQLDSADTAANRALAELGLDVTLVATLCGARLANLPLTGWWFLPLAALGAAGVFLALTLREVKLQNGLSPELAYAAVVGKDTPTAYKVILGMFEEALEANAGLIDSRFATLTFGQYILAGTILLGPVLLFALHGVGFPG